MGRRSARERAVGPDRDDVVSQRDADSVTAVHGAIPDELIAIIIRQQRTRRQHRGVVCVARKKKKLIPCDTVGGVRVRVRG